MACIVFQRYYTEHSLESVYSGIAFHVDQVSYEQDMLIKPHSTSTKQWKSMWILKVQSMWTFHEQPGNTEVFLKCQLQFRIKWKSVHTATTGSTLLSCPLFLPPAPLAVLSLQLSATLADEARLQCSPDRLFWSTEKMHCCEEGHLATVLPLLHKKARPPRCVHRGQLKSFCGPGSSPWALCSTPMN